jgi:NADH-quinone oxidoreductase subunit G
VPEEANGRGLAEAGMLPGAGPGLSEAPAGRDAPAIRAALESEELSAAILANVNPVRDYPDSDGWKEALQNADFVVAISMFANESTAHADVVFPAESHAEKEGTVTHPDGRLQRLRMNVPLPGEVRPGWQLLTELTAALDDETGLDSPGEVFEALASEAPIYSGITYDDIGGQGLRWQEHRRPTGEGSEGAVASSPDTSPGGNEPPPAEPVAGRRSASVEEAPAPSNGRDIRLGTYRDLWSGGVTEVNPSLEFLTPHQTLELAPADAERLGVQHAQEVVVSSNGHRIEARVAVRDRMRPGAGFLIEGTAQNNANLLAGAETVEVSAAEEAE